jgi:hypothetical protein
MGMAEALARVASITEPQYCGATCRVGKANGSRERAPDDRLRMPTIQFKS